MTVEQSTPGRTPLERLLGDTEPIRRALYPVVVAVVALLVAYGLLDAETVPLWLALAVAVLGPGGIEAARRVAWAPATVGRYAEDWQAALADEYARGLADGFERTSGVHDEPGEHAAPEVRTADGAEVDAYLERAEQPGEPTEGLERQDAPTGLMRAPSRATRCREVDDGRRCVLTRDHSGPHSMPSGIGAPPLTE